MNPPVTDDISLAALRYAASLTQVSAPGLAQRLYLYNRFPLSHSLRHSFPNEQAVASFLLEDRTDELHGFLSGTSFQISSPDRYWTRLTRGRPVLHPTMVLYKLYVAATLEAAPQALLAILKALPLSGAIGLKVARRVETLVRPDKLVIYFESFDEMLLMTRNFEDVLAELPVHDVPFTCRFDHARSGIFFWGIDPPARPGEEPLSWRRWITMELALGLSRNPEWRVDQRVRAALEGMQEKGVNPHSWQPDPMVWSRKYGAEHV